MPLLHVILLLLDINNNFVISWITTVTSNSIKRTLPYNYKQICIPANEMSSGSVVVNFTGFGIQQCTLSTCYCTYYAGGWGNNYKFKSIFIGI